MGKDGASDVPDAPSNKQLEDERCELPKVDEKLTKNKQVENNLSVKLMVDKNSNNENKIVKKRRKKTRRSGKKNKKLILQKFKILFNNVRGFKKKEESIKDVLEEEKPVMLVLLESFLEVEVHIEEIYYKENKYEVIRLERKGKYGGGILIFIHKKIKSITTIEKVVEEPYEGCWININNQSHVKMKIGVVYAPQESRTEAKSLKKMYDEIKTNVDSAKMEGMTTLIMGDFNCKVGDIINGNTPDVSKGGKMLKELLSKGQMVLVNSSSKCVGKWTRQENEKNSIIDYVMIDENSEHCIKSMKIDEEKDMGFYRQAEERGKGSVLYSDHNTIEVVLNLKEQIKMQKETENDEWKSRCMNEKECEKFKIATENDQTLIQCWMNEGKNLQEKYSDWSSKILTIKRKCMNVKKKNKGRCKTKKIKKLMNQKRKIRKQVKNATCIELRKELVYMQHTINQHINKREKMIQGLKRKNNIETIVKNGGIRNGGFWKLKKKFDKQAKEPACAIRTSNGKMINNSKEIKEEYASFYKNLLTSRNTEPEIEDDVQIIFSQILRIAELEGNEEITKVKIDKSIRNLKKRKASDVQGWSNEMLINAGQSLKESVWIALNEIKNGNVIPDEWEDLKIKSIHKKGSRHELGNRRGLFITSIISKLYEKILLEDNADMLDGAITESQCGGKKKRGTSDQLFTMYRILEFNQYIGDEINVVFVDAEKCFDKLWLKSCLISLWEKGMKASEVKMLYLMNRKAKIVVETPIGRTEEFSVDEIVKQGTVWGPKLCCSQTDEINKYGSMITTMGTTKTDCRIFVDDMAGIGRYKVSQQMISACQFFEKYKKYSFSDTKSMVMKMNTNSKTKKVERKPLQISKGVIKETIEYKYLGDTITSDGKMKRSIEEKSKKVKMMTSKVKKWTHEAEVGDMAIEIRFLLYDTMIMPTILSNTETWSELLIYEAHMMEQIQYESLSYLLEQKKNTSYWGLLIETGIWPVQQKIDKKKLMYWHSLLNSDDQRHARTIMAECFKQPNHPWTKHVKNLETKYGLNVNECEGMTKEQWKKKITNKISTVITKTALEEIETHTKIRFCMPHQQWRRQKYLTEQTHSNAIKLLQFKLNMNDLKSNYKNLYRDDQLCELCKESEENNEHLMNCSQLTRYRKKVAINLKNLLSNGNQEEMNELANYLKQAEKSRKIKMEKSKLTENLPCTRNLLLTLKK